MSNKNKGNQDLLDMTVRYYLYHGDIPKTDGRSWYDSGVWSPIGMVLFREGEFDYGSQFWAPKCEELDLKAKDILDDLGHDGDFLLRLDNIAYSSENLDDLMLKLEEFAVSEGLKINRKDKKDNQEVFDMIMEYIAETKTAPHYDYRTWFRTPDGKLSPIGLVLVRENKYDESCDDFCSKSMKIQKLLASLGYNGEFLTEIDLIVRSSYYESHRLQLRKFAEKHGLTIRDNVKEVVE